MASACAFGAVLSGTHAVWRSGPLFPFRKRVRFRRQYISGGPNGSKPLTASIYRAKIESSCTSWHHMRIDLLFNFAYHERLVISPAPIR